MKKNTFLFRVLALLAVVSPWTALTPAPASAAVPLTARISQRVVLVGRGMSVTGQAAPGSRVSLAWRRGGTWQHLRTVVAGIDGGYRVAVPTWWIGDRTVRVSSTDPTTGVRASDRLMYDVNTTYLPQGSSTSFGRYVGENYWDPCGVVTWRFTPGGYAGSLRTVKAAIRKVSSATGLRFAYRGTTHRVAFRDGAPSAGVDLLISWATPRQVPSLAGSEVGSALSTTGYGGYYDDGELALDRTAHLRHGFHSSGAVDWGQVMLHELGHVVGLRHVGSRSEIMYPDTTRRTHRYGAGDLAGLRAVGARRPCAA
ncbi:matrixin family metalloprotease [Nocardioides ultimimeridianus]